MQASEFKHLCSWNRFNYFCVWHESVFSVFKGNFWFTNNFHFLASFILVIWILWARLWGYSNYCILFHKVFKHIKPFYFLFHGVLARIIGIVLKLFRQVWKVVSEFCNSLLFSVIKVNYKMLVAQLKTISVWLLISICLASFFNNLGLLTLVMQLLKKVDLFHILQIS